MDFLSWKGASCLKIRVFMDWRKSFLLTVMIFFIVTGLLVCHDVVKGAMSSGNYRIDLDVVGSFGNESGSSSFVLGDTGGEVATGFSSSGSYSLNAGFWQRDIYNISIACSDSVTMGSIVGTGKSNLTTNSGTCVVITDNPAGYKLEWQASAVNMSNGADTIAGYTPAVADTPEVWSVDAANSEWGARLSSVSTATDNKWGTDDQVGVNYGTTAKWLNVRASTPYQIIQRSGVTSLSGDNEVINFGAEVGANKMQPSGNYQVNITITATTL